MRYQNPEMTLPFYKKMARENVYVIDLEEAQKDSKCQAALKNARKFGDLVFAVLENAENGYWSYIVTCQKWPGKKGFVFTGVGGLLGLIRHLVSLRYANKDNKVADKFIEIIDLIAEQVSNNGTIINYLLQSFTAPTNNAANYAAIGTFTGSSLAGVLLALKISQLEELKAKGPKKYLLETTRLSKFLLSKNFKIIAAIYNTFMNGLSGASFFYYFFDTLASLGVNIPSSTYNGLQVFGAIFYAGLNAVCDYEAQFKEEQRSFKKIAVGLSLIQLMLLITNSSFAFVSNSYLLLQIIMDAIVVATKDNGNISNKVFYGILSGIMLVALSAFIHHTVTEKEEMLEADKRVENAAAESVEIGGENSQAANAAIIGDDKINIKNDKEEQKDIETIRNKMINKNNEFESKDEKAESKKIVISEFINRYSFFENNKLEDIMEETKQFSP